VVSWRHSSAAVLYKYLTDSGCVLSKNKERALHEPESSVMCNKAILVTTRRKFSPVFEREIRAVSLSRLTACLSSRTELLYQDPVMWKCEDLMFFFFLFPSRKQIMYKSDSSVFISGKKYIFEYLVLNLVLDVTSKHRFSVIVLLPDVRRYLFEWTPCAFAYGYTLLLFILLGIVIALYLYMWMGL